MRKLFPSSEKAKAPAKKSWLVRKYPWNEVLPGFSFIVGKNEGVSVQTLKVQAYKASKRLNKRFVVVDHGDNGIEVACFEPEILMEQE